MVRAIIFVLKKTMRYIKITSLISILLLVLVGCGQRGPLYSPDKAPETTPVPSTNAVSSQSTLPVSEGA